MNDNKLSVGYLIVNAVTADGLLPVEGALITVSISSGGDTYVYRVLRTDRSGKTGQIAIPTPDISLSLSPSDQKPFTEVTIEGDKEGFYTGTYINAPVFPQTVTLQQVNLIPKDPRVAIGQNDTVYYETEPEDL